MVKLFHAAGAAGAAGAGGASAAAIAETADAMDWAAATTCVSAACACPTSADKSGKFPVVLILATRAAIAAEFAVTAAVKAGRPWVSADTSATNCPNDESKSATDPLMSIPPMIISVNPAKMSQRIQIMLVCP